MAFHRKIEALLGLVDKTGPRLALASVQLYSAVVYTFPEKRDWTKVCMYSSITDPSTVCAPRVCVLFGFGFGLFMTIFGMYCV